MWIIAAIASMIIAQGPKYVVIDVDKSVEGENGTVLIDLDPVFLQRSVNLFQVLACETAHT